MLLIRPLAARDSYESLTSLLHRAYAEKSLQGLPFSAASHSVEDTRRSAARGHCLVAEREGTVIGCITLLGPHEGSVDGWRGTDGWFGDRDTIHTELLAVDPCHQGNGVGQRLVRASEAWAIEHGYRCAAVEVAEPATALRALYRRHGYVEVGRAQREDVSFPSLILHKRLDRSPLREHLQTLARYHLWATKRLLRSVDLLSDGDYRRNVGLAFQSVHGTLNHLLLVEDRLWGPRFTIGASPILALDTEIEADRAALREQLIEAVLSWVPLLEVWPEARLHQTLRYQRMNGQQVALPVAPTLAHVFNHGTHHRGQISGALTAFGLAAPALDLVYMLQDEHPALADAHAA